MKRAAAPPGDGPANRPTLVAGHTFLLSASSSTRERSAANGPSNTHLLDHSNARRWGYSVYVFQLRVPGYEGGRLMPPSWFLRFWTGQAGPGRISRGLRFWRQLRETPGGYCGGRRRRPVRRGPVLAERPGSRSRRIARPAWVWSRRGSERGPDRPDHADCGTQGYPMGWNSVLSSTLPIGRPRKLQHYRLEHPLLARPRRPLGRHPFHHRRRHPVPAGVPPPRRPRAPTRHRPRHDRQPDRPGLPLGIRLDDQARGLRQRMLPPTFGHYGSTGTVAWADPASGLTASSSPPGPPPNRATTFSARSPTPSPPPRPERLLTHLRVTPAARSDTMPTCIHHAACAPSLPPCF